MFLKPKLGRKLAFAALLVLLVVLPMKLIVDAPRPCENCDNMSFPSYHASSSFSTAVILSSGFPQAAPAFFALAILVSYSRLHLGVHTLVDVVAGAVIGAAVAAGSLRLFKKKTSKKVTIHK